MFPDPQMTKDGKQGSWEVPKPAPLPPPPPLLPLREAHFSWEGGRWQEEEVEPSEKCQLSSGSREPGGKQKPGEAIWSEEIGEDTEKERKRTEDCSMESTVGKGEYKRLSLHQMKLKWIEIDPLCRFIFSAPLLRQRNLSHPLTLKASARKSHRISHKSPHSSVFIPSRPATS